MSTSSSSSVALTDNEEAAVAMVETDSVTPAFAFQPGEAVWVRVRERERVVGMNEENEQQYEEEPGLVLGGVDNQSEEIMSMDSSSSSNSGSGSVWVVQHSVSGRRGMYQASQLRRMLLNHEGDNDDCNNDNENEGRITQPQQQTQPQKRSRYFKQRPPDDEEDRENCAISTSPRSTPRRKTRKGALSSSSTRATATDVSTTPPPSRRSQPSNASSLQTTTPTPAPAAPNPTSSTRRRLVVTPSPNPNDNNGLLKIHPRSTSTVPPPKKKRRMIKEMTTNTATTKTPSEKRRKEKKNSTTTNECNDKNNEEDTVTNHHHSHDDESNNNSDDDDDSNNNSSNAEEEEEAVEEDRPYTIELAKTSRSTCKRCDMRIDKGSLRIAHKPLFRGKPGFTVYRHLHCTVFDAHIQQCTDIAGMQRLNKTQREMVHKQIAHSAMERHEEFEEISAEELVQTAFAGPFRSTPPGMLASMQLLPFQVEGASWMYNQEHTDVRGGILADEMGMGKTIQTIATILDHKPQLQHARPNCKHAPNVTASDRLARIQEEAAWQGVARRKEWEHEMRMHNIPPALWPPPPSNSRNSNNNNKSASSSLPQRGQRAGTLVVCPVIALLQWKTELEKFTQPNVLSIGIYHGPDRQKLLPAALLCKYDVILTTYQVIEQDFRKMISPNKVACPNCQALFKIDKLHVHLKYFCGATAQRTAAQMRQRRTRPMNPASSSSSHVSSSSRRQSKDSSKKAQEQQQKQKQKEKERQKQEQQRRLNPVQRPNHVDRTKNASDNDSDSSSRVSMNEEDDKDQNARPRRASRSAAIAASRTLSTGLVGSRRRRYGDNKDDDDDDDDANYVDSEEQDNDDDSYVISASTATGDEESSVEVERGASTRISRKTTRNNRDIIEANRTSSLKRSRSHREASSSSSDNDEDDEALVRARTKQQQALDAAREGKKEKNKKQQQTLSGKKITNKPIPSKKPNKKMTANRRGKGAGKGKKKKMKGESSSDDSSDNDSDDEDSDVDDLMANINMNELSAEAMNGAKFSVLHGFTWWRVVLDEAHFIKSRNSQTAASAFALTSVHRWCLTGTPLQNRVGELYSLIRFIRLDPMACYFCRQCSCKSLHYRIKHGICQDCGHRAFSHFSHFNKHVLNPIQRDGYTGDGRRAMFALKNEVLDTCLLRRTKENRAEDMNLPPRIVTIRPVRLHPVEEDFYSALYTQTKASFDDYVAEGTLLNNYAHIFDLLTKMRQAVNHPYLIVYSSSDKIRALHQQSLRQGHGSSAPQPQVANGSIVCDLCHETPVERVVSSCCGAGFCRSCVIEYLTGAIGDDENNRATPCPSCARPFTIDLNQAAAVPVDDCLSSSEDVSSCTNTPQLSQLTSLSPSETGDHFVAPSLKDLPHVAAGSILRRIHLNEFATSTKIEVLVQELTEMRNKRPGNKALVFSQFVNMLDLIRWRLYSDPCLTDLGLGVRILHGGMDVKSRDAALKDFREDPNCRVLLMSLKAAGVALNLTVASECYLTDLWWNPAAEMQAIDRTHRLGQYRPIRAVRLVAEGTVEERVLQLQEKKRLVFDGTIGRDAGSLKMLTVNDMVQLFS